MDCPFRPFNPWDDLMLVIEALVLFGLPVLASLILMLWAIGRS